jgi:hypothetical protein
MRRAPAFFAYARERYRIFLAREAGEPEPWTTDKILGRYRFCNVFREDDRVTRWFRAHVRDDHRLAGRPELLLATVVFRMFNRISAGEAIFCQTDIEGGTPFTLFATSGDARHLRRAVLAGCGRGPYVTGSYIISTPPGYSKLDGVLEILRRFWKDEREWTGLGAGVYDTMGWRKRNTEGAGSMLLSNPGAFTLEATWRWFSQFDYLGKFHSYEIVTDLRHTALLDRAPDVDEWANPGPGARRGLCRVQSKLLTLRIPREQQIEEMRALLSLSRDGTLWPAKWPRWELRDVEHTLCEFDKYERARLGQGRPRGVFR